MRGNEFIRRVQKHAKRKGISFTWRADRGKGSHGILTLGDTRTVVRNPKNELKTGTYHGSSNSGSPSATSHSENTMLRFTYPIKLKPDRDEGGYVVTCRDIPEAITQGETIADAIAEAEGALQAAIEGRIEDGLDIPSPSQARRGERLGTTPITTALKAAVYIALRDSGISKSEFARRMQVNEKEARRMLDPKHPTKVPTLERALAALGRRAEIEVS